MSGARSLFTLLGAGALWLSAAPAAAQGHTNIEDVTPVTTLSGPRDRSPQWFALEVRVGRYVPDVDDNVAGSPFRDFFGDTNRYSFGLELDWQALRIPSFGSLGVGLGWTYTRMSGTNRIPEGEPPVLVDQKSSLGIMPLYLVGVLRVDVLMRLFGIPIVPYAKGGLGYAFWWVNDGVGIAREDETGRKGSDTSYGPQWALGGMLLLDGIDEGSAKALDNEFGVNNSYLFGEWYQSKLGSANRMEVGTNTWVVGFAIEM